MYQNHFGKPASELGIKEIREFLHYLKTEKKLSNGSINTYDSGLRFLHGVTLNIDLNYKQIPCQKKKHFMRLNSDMGCMDNGKSPNLTTVTPWKRVEGWIVGALLE
ncbi:MAG TPA: phage integrase N-terminal SAM-like domain-containing protein [Spirochaetia bacterium]|nr:phage integrase N-terminal SAM-like domain-containing protein [Spirochaetia bacterium]